MRTRKFCLKSLKREYYGYEFYSETHNKSHQSRENKGNGGPKMAVRFFFIVKRVVEHGQCIRENRIKQTAVV